MKGSVNKTLVLSFCFMSLFRLRMPVLPLKRQEGHHSRWLQNINSSMDIPRVFLNITERAPRIHTPFTPDKYVTLVAALRLSEGARVLDLGSGSGEMLSTWARDLGIDMSPCSPHRPKAARWQPSHAAIAWITSTNISSGLTG